MLKSIIKSSEISGSFLKVSLFSLTAIAALVASADAQSLNDDLKPKKEKSEVRAREPRRVKKTFSKPVRKSQPRRTSQNQAVKTVAQPAATVESPAQIIERFMNYNQSASVQPKDWESVIKQNTQSLQSNPNDINAKAQMLTAQGELAYLRGDYSNALVQFNAASQVLPNSALPHYGIGKVYLITKQPAEAEKSFEQAIKLNKTFALAYKGMGDALTAQGKVKKAKEYYADAGKVGVSSGSLYVNASSSGQTPAVSSPNVSNVSATNQRPQPAQPSVGASPSAYQNELKTAKTLTAKKKWKESLDKLLPLAQTNPNADLYIAIGENYVGLEQMLSAQQAFRKATEFNPNSALAFYKSGQVLFEMNEYKAAAEAFEKSLILDQRGSFINRREARRMADKANEKFKNPDGKKKFLNIL